MLNYNKSPLSYVAITALILVELPCKHKASKEISTLYLLYCLQQLSTSLLPAATVLCTALESTFVRVVLLLLLDGLFNQYANIEVLFLW